MISNRFFRMKVTKNKQIRYNCFTRNKREYDLVIEGKLKGQNGFGMSFNKYDSGDIVDLDFFKGNAICLYKKDVEALIKYLQKISKRMK